MAILTNAGRAILTNRIKGAGTEPINMGIGSGSTTAEAVTNTALQTEFTTGTWTGYARLGSGTGATSSQQTTTSANDTYQVVGTFTAPGTANVQEAGLFDAATGGNMLIRGLTGGVSLASGDSIQLTIKLTFA